MLPLLPLPPNDCPDIGGVRQLRVWPASNVRLPAYTGVRILTALTLLDPLNYADIWFQPDSGGFDEPQGLDAQGDYYKPSLQLVVLKDDPDLMEAIERLRAVRHFVAAYRDANGQVKLVGTPHHPLRFVLLDGEISTVTSLYTASFVELENGPSTPIGLLIPTRPGTDGLTLLYYSRAPTGFLGDYRIFIDASAGIAAGLDSYGENGNFRRPDDLFVNGSPYAPGPKGIYMDNPTNAWVLMGLRTVPSLTTFPAGGLSLNMYAGFAHRGYGAPYLLIGRILVYYRRLTNAEFAAVLPPGDFEQEYTFASYQPGDQTVTDTVSGRDATLYY